MWNGGSTASMRSLPSTSTGGEPPVVVDQLAEADMAVVPADFAELTGGLHFRDHRIGIRSYLGEAADNQLLQPCLAQHRRPLRIERSHIERDQDIGAAVLDLVFE